MRFAPEEKPYVPSYVKQESDLDSRMNGFACGIVFALVCIIGLLVYSTDRQVQRNGEPSYPIYAAVR